MEKNKSRQKRFLPLIAIAIFIGGIIIGIRFQASNLDRQYTLMQRWNKLTTVLNIIDKEYVDPINRKEIEEKNIEYTLKSLDPHSVYIPASQMKEVNEPLEGNFDGIGVTFNMINDTVIVINTIPGGPSERVGVMGGDRIITVNDSVIAGINIPQDSVVKLLRGKSGTKVKVGIQRVDERKLIPITITRGKIPIKSLDIAYMSTPDIGYIKLSRFSKTTSEEFHSAAEKLLSEGMGSLILDLRDNSGGYLDQAYEIANEFIEAGKLIVYTEGKARERYNLKANRKGILKHVPVVVLINEGSASASEIVAGAIQDNDRGYIVGRRSFGKGLVQEPITFSDGSGIRMTVARYYTPTGRSIQRPYDKGDDDYYMELMRRYEHGEYSQVDSIKQNDSLKYITPEGRIVYGGGGIMPDIFVPIDTTGYNEYYRTVSRKNLIYKFAIYYSDKHRKRINSSKTIAELKKQLHNRGIVTQFVDYAAEQGVSGTEEDIKQCWRILDAQIKAYIGRSTPLDNDGFYPFLEPIDKTIQVAKKTLEEKK